MRRGARWTSRRRSAGCGLISIERGLRGVTSIGFIGLGVMGGAMCRNIAAKHDGPVLAFDLSPQAGEAIAGTAARFAPQAGAIWEAADVVFLSLPGSVEVEAV